MRQWKKNARSNTKISKSQQKTKNGKKYQIKFSMNKKKYESDLYYDQMSAKSQKNI